MDGISRNWTRSNARRWCAIGLVCLLIVVCGSRFHAVQAQPPGQQWAGPPMMQGSPMMGPPTMGPPTMGPPTMGPPTNYGMPPMYEGGTPIRDYYIGSRNPQWDRSGPVEGFMGQLAQRTWVRVEFLLWEMQGPGDTLIGAPVLSDELIRSTRSVQQARNGRRASTTQEMMFRNRDTSDPFEISDNLGNSDTIDQSLGFAVVPNLDAISLSDTPGVRGTFGMPFDGGSLELDFWGTAQRSGSLMARDISVPRQTPDFNVNNPNPPPQGTPEQGTQVNPNIAISLLFDDILDDNQPAQRADAGGLNAIVFDERFRADLDSQLWGTELNFFRNYPVTNTGMLWEPLAGFRLMNLQEEFDVSGTYNNGRQDTTNRVSQFSARSTNTLWGPQLGFRLKLVQSRFSLSATPRVAFALNNYSNHVYAGPLLEPVDPTLVDVGDSRQSIPRSHTKEQAVDFSPIAQVSFKANVQVSSWMSLYAGYDFMWTNRVTRPFNNIDYNSTRNDDQEVVPVLSLQSDFDSFWTHGLSVGGEIRLP